MGEGGSRSARADAHASCPVVAFVLTLEGDEHRCEPTEAALDALGIPYRVTLGADARAGSATSVEDLVQAGEVSRSAADRLSPGGIGCALSHQRIYQAIIDDGIPLALVIEDDAVLAPNLAELLADPTPFLFDDRVTMLFYAHHGADPFLVSTQDSVALPDGAAVLLPIDGNFRSTVGYLVTNEAARRLRAANFPVEFPADGWDQYLWRGALAAMQIVHPAPVGHRDEEASTRLSGPAPSTRSAALAATAKRWLHPRTTPPVAWFRMRRRFRVRLQSRVPVLVDHPSPFREPADLGPLPADEPGGGPRPR